jgi:beta-lactamase regulating signal transducer with metallopeptidase domain
MNEQWLVLHPFANPTLLTVVLQSTLWLAVGLVAARIWRRRAGRAHLLLILATSAALISPALTEAVRRMEWGVLPPSPAPPEEVPVVVVTAPEPARELPAAQRRDVPFDELLEQSREPATDQAAEPAREEQIATLPPPKTEPDPEPEAPPVKPPRTAGIAERIPSAVAGLWLCASLILTIRLVLSLFSGRQIARRAQEETSPRLWESLRAAAGALGLRTPPLLRVSPQIRCPMIWCWGARPVVLLPESAAQQPQILWRSVFCHELAHLVRRDHWSALWAELLIIIVPWQPLAWRARRRLAFLREQACDDWVLSVGGEATDYAESLLQLVPQGSPVHALAAVSSRESLKRRLEHVLAGVRITPKVGRRWVLAASLFAVAAIAGVGFAQQGKRSAAPTPEPAPQLEVAEETKPSAPPPHASSPPAQAAPNPKPSIAAPTPPSTNVVAVPPPVKASVPATVREIHGRVLLPNGQRAAGATVRLVRSRYGWNESPYDEVKVLARLTSGPQGEFQLSTDSAVEKELVHNVQLWASLPGYGAALHSFDSNDKTDSFVLRLAEELPIRGRIVDLEGRPVRDARVEAVRYIDTTTAAVDEWLASSAGMEKPVSIVTDKGIEGRVRDSLALFKKRSDTAILQVNSIEVVSDAVFPLAKTDADGRFEFKGVGRDRIVILQVSAPHSTTVFPASLTRTLKSNPFPPGEISGPEFERIAPPSAPIEGIVTDEESGKPVPGAVMNPHLWHQALGLAGNFAIALPATADATGHYRLEGIDRFNTNMLTITVGDLPYFGGSAQVPVAKGLEPTHVDIKLKRGVWARGRAYDQVTGKPVDGHVAYSPSSSNKLRRGFSARSMRGAQTDAAGQFRVLVLPGRGMVYLSCKGDYRFNAGAALVKDFRSFSQVGINRVCEIDVPVNVTEAHVDLPADPGQNVLLKFADATGHRLSGVDAYGLRFPQPRSALGYARTFSEGDTAILYAVSPEDVRRVWFRHRASGLNRMFRFKQKPGETERTIVLDPPAIVTGRFVTPEGKPITGLSVSCLFNSRGGPGGIRGFEDVSCDAQGRFQRDLPAGDWITLMAAPEGTLYLSGALIARSMTVASGEQIDLGDIAIEHDPKRPGLINARHGKEKRTKPPESTTATTAPASATRAPKKTAPTPSPEKANASTARELRGRVLLPNGQPAVGATVTLIHSTASIRDFDQWKTIATLRADSRGEFQGAVEISAAKNLRGDLNLWATLPGYGLALHPFSLRGKSDAIVMHLVEDDPIRGHLLDVDGRPVRDATVEALTLYDSTPAWIEAFIASAKDKPTSMSWRFSQRQTQDDAPSREGAVLRVKASADVPHVLIPPVKTGADGRFELRGLGRDRYVYLRVSGTRVATTLESVVTRPIKPIPFQFREVYGSQFERVAAPSVPVEGVVTEEESGKPIPGVTIRPFARKNGQVIIVATGPLVSTNTDSQGRFRLEGLDTGTENRCRVDVVDLPYLPLDDVSVPASVGFKPIRLDIKLHSAVWATGRAYDRATGLPVKGSVLYTPFRSNEFAQKFAFVRRPFFRLSSGTVEADGRFRVRVIPGRGVVCLTCNDNSHRFDFGKSEIKELVNAAKHTTAADSPTLMPLEDLTYHSLREISVPPDAREVHVDLPVERGDNVMLKFTDAAGKPLAGVETYGLHGAGGRGYTTTEKDSALLRATFPGETRPIWLKHRTSGLTRLFDFTTKPAETERTIILQAPAVVTGRLVGEDGAPFTRVRVETTFSIRFPSVSTNADGRFRCELPAGGPFDLRARVSPSGSDFAFPVELAEKLTVVAGEQVDLGTITIEPGAKGSRQAKVLRSPVKRTAPTSPVKATQSSTDGSRGVARTQEHKSPKPHAARAVAAKDTQSGDSSWLFRGTVLRPDGQPAAGAQVLALRRYWSARGSWRPMATARAGVKGEFELRVPHQWYDGLGSGFIGLAARADGFGVEWVRGRIAVDPQPLVLKLVPESSIHGHVVDLEGRPVSGVRVQVREQTAPREGEDLNPWLDAVKKGLNGHRMLGEQLPGYEDGTSPAIVSDPDGRFVVRGIGPERMVRLQVSGESIASAQFEVVTRQITPMARTAGIAAPSQVFGKDFTYQATPTKPIVGTVRDGVTGRPLAAVRLELSRHDFIATQTDAEGKFRLVGMPKETVTDGRMRSRLVAVPDLDRPYFGNEVDIPETAGLEPVTIDIKLKRGLWITGRVTEKGTAKPVPARVQYFPYGSNSFVNADEWRVFEGSRPTDESRHVTRPDGTYRILGLPGHGIVGASAVSLSYLSGVGASEIPGMAKDGHFPTLGNPLPADARRQHALKEINPLQGSESVACDLTLDPGGRVRLALVDGAGKPVADSYLVYSDGVRNVTGRESDPSFDIAGLAPKESRTYLISQWQRKIAKVFALEYDGKPSSALTITLEPTATVQGRLVDEDGSPLKNVEVRATAMRNGKRVLDLFPFAAHTDADGRFVCGTLAAGCDSYKIQALEPQRGFVTVAEKVSFAPGKTIDLGEIKLRSPQ